MVFILITGQARHQKWDNVCTIARNNGFPLQIIHNLKSKIIRAQKDKKILLHKHKEKNGSHLHIIVHSYTKSPSCSNAPT